MNRIATLTVLVCAIPLALSLPASAELTYLVGVGDELHRVFEQGDVETFSLPASVFTMAYIATSGRVK